MRSGEINFLPETAVHGLFHCAENVFIAGAAAQVAGQELAQFLIAVELSGLQDFFRSHDKAGRTEAALDGSLVDEGLLDIRQLSVRAAKPLQCEDLLALRPDCQVDAGIEGLPVDQNVAGAALADLAALFDRGQRTTLYWLIRSHLLHG